jgi:branched-chain amino acid transport system ATP-binding protein
VSYDVEGRKMILDVNEINTFYGKSHILHGVSLKISPGEAVVLLGRNGAGKTTTLRSIMGLTQPRDGSVVFNGEALTGKPAYKIAQLGIGFVPEDRRIFPHLTVLENLDIGRKSPRTGSQPRKIWDAESVLDLFPHLKQFAQRRGGTLSGGEQQMLTIGRTLMGNPLLLLLDEPTEGLAPLIVRAIGQLVRVLREQRVTMLLSEQNVKFSLRSCDLAYIIDDGHIVYSGASQELKEQPDVMKKYLAV